MSDHHSRVHGHAVIERVAAHPEGIQQQRLSELLHAEFGDDVRFHTCSADGMTFSELLVFLADRHKVELRGDLVFPGGSPACGDDHEGEQR